ncbi:hypothetical protein [Halalkalicoccus sp. NIPERK01]|uniref:hypothetical protein n=1 Tax=Halalkalicoccus sp. NIPERK01 TaxID=3053469 RepID=UPI00256F14AF|nr:hypothetical protein [Halalkalicoccus sp. NIPERK01]MDL5362084.1 hypothetical protein [Halalkalicoccus sp. NIPERK01]
MAHEFTDEDRDKPVRVVDGERVGTVSDVRDGRASVEEDEGITDAIKEKLGWDDDDGSHELGDAAIERVDDDGVWIRQI